MLIYTSLVDKNKRVFVYEEGNWSVKGRFDTALQVDDPILWDNEAGEYSLIVALVRICLCSVLFEDF